MIKFYFLYRLFWTISMVNICIIEQVMVYTGRLMFNESHIFLLALFILLMFWRNRISWYCLLILSIYGLYNLAVNAPIAAYGTEMDFGFYAILLSKDIPSFKYLYKPWAISLHLFYLSNFIMLLSGFMRRRYGIDFARFFMLKSAT